MSKIVMNISDKTVSWYTTSGPNACNFIQTAEINGELDPEEQMTVLLRVLKRNPAVREMLANIDPNYLREDTDLTNVEPVLFDPWDNPIYLIIRDGCGSTAAPTST